MTEPLGTERIVVTPDTTAFRAELEAQVAAALASVQSQVRAVRIAAPVVPTPQAPTSAGGVILPASVRSVEATQNAAAAQKELVASAGQAAVSQRSLGTASERTATQTRAATAETQRLAAENRNAAAALQRQSREIQTAETSLGRLTRGSVAAAAASSGIFRAISFASGAFLVGAAAGGAAAAGIAEFNENAKVTATTTQLIKATGSAANLTEAQISRLATTQEHLTGVDDELIQSGQNVLLTFRGIRDEVGAGNQIFSRASRAALDVSQVLGTSLRSTAIQLGKALQDPVRGITALRRSGISFTQDQRKTITTLEETGRHLEAQRLILAEVERQTGGTAEAIGRTLPGRLNILQERARDALGEYVGRLQESDDASRAAAAGGEVLRSAFDGIRSALSTIGPQITQTGEGLARATGAVGGPGPVLALVVGYKALGVAINTATGVKALYTAATATAARAELAEAVAANTVTASLERQAAAETTAAAAARRRIGAITLLTGALAVGSAASGQWTAALLLGSTALTGFAARGIAAFRAAQAGGTALALIRGGAAALGGPVGIASIAVGGLATALFLLHRRAGQATGTLKGFQNALGPLERSLSHLQNVQERIATQSENITLGRLDVQQAQRRVGQATANLQRSNAPEGSIEREGLEALVGQARDKLREATVKLRREEDALAATQREAAAINRARPSVVANQTRAVRQQIDALRQNAGVFTQTQREQLQAAELGARQARAREQENRTLAARLPADQRGGLLRRAAEEGRRAAALEAESAAIRQRVLRDTETAATRAAAAILDPLAKSGNAARRALALPLQGIIEQLHRLPTRRETQIAIRLVAQGASVDEIFQALGIRPPKASGAEAASSAQALAIQRRASALAAVRGERQELRPLEEELQKRKEILRTAQDQVKAAQDSVKAAQDQVQSSQESVLAARDQVVSARQAVTAAREQRVSALQALNDAREQARLSRQSLRETVRDAKDAVRQAVDDAKGNLNQLAEAIGQTLNQVAGGVQRRGNLGEAFRRMRDEILRSRGPEAQGAQTALAFRVNANVDQTPENDFAKRLTNLSDAFNFGRLRAPAFLREFDRVIKAIDPQVLRQKLGNLATDTLLAQVRAVRRQVPLITRAPRTPGGGLVQQVVSPAKAQEDAAKQIAAAQRDLRGSLRSIGEAQKGVRDATRGVGDAIKDIAQAQTQLRAAERSRERADREFAAARRRESAAEVKALKRNADVTDQHRLVMQQLAKVVAARDRLDRVKPAGRANAATTNITTHGVLAAE